MQLLFDCSTIVSGQIITELKIRPLMFGVMKFIVGDMFSCSSLSSGLVLTSESNITTGYVGTVCAPGSLPDSLNLLFL